MQNARQVLSNSEIQELQQDILKDLNPAQREVAETFDGAFLVLAGAGTGKTRALTTRLAHMIQSGHTQAWRSLTVTFTNKAANEMRQRVAQLVGENSQNLWLGTFHALSMRMLRRHAELVGLKSDFTVFDTDDQIRLLKNICEDMAQKRFPPRYFCWRIQRWKDKNWTPETLPELELAAEGEAHYIGREIYARYQNSLRDLNACDFGDLIMHMLTLFRTEPNIAAQWAERFTHIMVDEYQDTNAAQFQWIYELSRASGNLCCVGDDDQSIYSWRGAEIDNILGFSTHFPGAKIIRLEHNYRSTGHILEAASGLIAYNRGRLGKTLHSGLGKGEKIGVLHCLDGRDEAEQIAQLILERHYREKTPFRSMAILVRAGFQTRQFEDVFLTRGLPYRIYGGIRFYQREEIRDSISWLRLACRPQDDLAFQRAISRPARGIGTKTLDALRFYARDAHSSLFDAAKHFVDTGGIRAHKALRELVQHIENWQEFARTEAPALFARRVLRDSGYEEFLRRDPSPELAARRDNVAELLNELARYTQIGDFLDHVALVAEELAHDGQRGDFLTLMTLHGAKGLEFDTVFLPGWEEAIFPSPRSLEEKHGTGLEEERRLAYVGLTRARRALFISHAARRQIYGNWQNADPSRFLKELPQHALWRSSGVRFATPQFEPGARCASKTFGLGTVVQRESETLVIDFDDGVRRRLVSAFVRPAE